jgi:hypothetical protein
MIRAAKTHPTHAIGIPASYNVSFPFVHTSNVQIDQMIAANEIKSPLTVSMTSPAVGRRPGYSGSHFTEPG